jgi:hypothetical protein
LGARSDGASKEFVGPPEWRYPESGNAVWLSPNAAVRHVKQLRRSTTDPEVKRNADKTISTLQQIAHTK